VAAATAAATAATTTVTTATTAATAATTATARRRQSMRSTEAGGGLVSLLRALQVVKAEADPEVVLVSSVNSSMRRSFRASWKDRNGLVRFKAIFKLSNFLFNPRRRFRKRV
jgi:hypothetical protein